MTYFIGIASTLPNMMPPTRAGVIKFPTSPSSCYSTCSGSLTMQRDDHQPLVKANTDMLRILNQSELNSQLGPTSKAVNKNVATPNVRA